MSDRPGTFAVKIKTQVKNQLKNEIQFPLPCSLHAVSVEKFVCSFTLMMEAHHYNINLET
jgi:hypothetical protein